MRYSRGNLSHLFMSRDCSLAHSCKDLIAEMVHTKDGSRVVREFLARGTAKVCGVISFILVCALMMGLQKGSQAHYKSPKALHRDNG